MRKLARASIAFSAAVFMANYLIPIEWLVFIAVVSAFIGAALFAMRIKSIRILSSVFVFFSLGLIVFSIHSKNTVLKAKEYSGQTHKVVAEILDYPDVYEDYCRLYVRIKSPYLPNLKAVLYDNDKRLVDAGPGDLVTLPAKISAADTLYGEEYDGYHSKGIYLKLSSVAGAVLDKKFDIFYFPQFLGHWLSNRIEMIFPADTESFMRSLMLGDKSDFYDDEESYVSLSRAGLMHIVAVSGMHISFLIGLLQGVFGHGRRGAVLCIWIVWIFALATGFGPSVVRAAFMHTCYLMAPLLKRENDAITSLSFILALMLLKNPFAAANIGLQLSFGAMSGIVLFSERIFRCFTERLPRLSERTFPRYVLSSVSCSFAVMVFTVPLTAVHFGNVQLLMPITNLVSLWAVSICFCWGWVSCALSVVPFFGILSAQLCSWLARYILLTAELISAVPFSVMYMETKFSWLWIVLSYSLFFTAYLLKFSSLSAYLIVGAVSAFLAAMVLCGNILYHKGYDSINVLDVGQGQCISVLTEEASILIDCGNINTVDNAGEIAAGHLYGHGRYSLDILILSHLHHDHAGGAVTLMEMMPVKMLIMPEDCDTDGGLFHEICDCAHRNGTKLVLIDRDHSAQLGEVDIELYKLGSGLDENERCLITKVECNDIEMLAMADSSWSMEYELLERKELEDIDVLIVSHHGSKYSSTHELLNEIGGGVAVISVGNNYYGHPAEETLEALETYGYNVYRTDEDNDIKIKIGKNDGEKTWEERHKIKLPRRNT